MLPILSRIHLAYLGLLVITCVAMFGYEAKYVWPVQKCEAHGGWWSAKYDTCATPMPIWRITGRRLGVSASPR
jgi:hypothetical protein